MSRKKTFDVNQIPDGPLIPIRHGTKVAAIQKWTQEALTLDAAIDWLAKGGSIARRCDGIVVIDVDEKVLANELYLRFRNKLSVVVRSPRGAGHLYFSGSTKPAVKVNGQGYDIRSGNGSYILCPPSKGYEYIHSDWDNLQPVPPELLPQPSFNKQSSTKINDIEAWCAKVHAHSGSNGHSQTFKVACRLVDALGELDAFVAILRWNQTNAHPPWTEKELLHKIKSAARRNHA